MAEYGLSSAFYYILIALIFFIPVSLVSAELSTGWPKKGGIYLWVKEAFGQKWGFLAIWLQWIETIIWFPTVLAFAGATLAFIINPALATNPLFLVGCILTIFWGATLLNFRGVKTSGTITSIGSILGTIIPAMLIIILGAHWLFSGHPTEVELNWNNFFPDITNLGTIVLAASVLLAYSGMELSAVHAREVKNPQKDFPIAIGISVILILAIFILGTLAISIVIPKSEISLVAGIMDAFSQFFHKYNLDWMVPVIAVSMIIGVIAQISAWIIGPAKGLLETAKEGTLPKFFQKTNKAGVATNVLYIQAGVVSIISLVFIIMPNVSSSYWILTALTTQLYLIMYFILFLTAIKLRYSKADVVRTYKIPGGNFGMWIVAGTGAVASFAGIALGFVPPSQFQSGNLFFFEGFLIFGILSVVGSAFIIHLRTKLKQSLLKLFKKS